MRIVVWAVTATIAALVFLTVLIFFVSCSEGAGAPTPKYVKTNTVANHVGMTDADLAELMPLTEEGYTVISTRGYPPEIWKSMAYRNSNIEWFKARAYCDELSIKFAKLRMESDQARIDAHSARLRYHAALIANEQDKLSRGSGADYVKGDMEVVTKRAAFEQLNEEYKVKLEITKKAEKEYYASEDIYKRVAARAQVVRTDFKMRFEKGL